MSIKRKETNEQHIILQNNTEIKNILVNYNYYRIHEQEIKREQKENL